METDQMASSVSEFQAIVKNIDSELSRLQTLIAGEDDKMLRYKVGSLDAMSIIHETVSILKIIASMQISHLLCLTRRRKQPVSHLVSYIMLTRENKAETAVHGC